MNFSKHFSASVAEDIKRICQPLFVHLGISYFDYAQFYPKAKKALIISSDPGYVNFFLNDDIYKSQPPLIITSGFHLWDEYINTDFLTTVRNSFKYTHGLTIKTVFNDYDEVINFATRHDNAKINDFYLNQKPLINKFIVHFRQAAAKIIKAAAVHKIDMAIPASHMVTTQHTLGQYANVEKELFHQENFSIALDNKLIQLTSRETECLSYLTQGMTAKMIAKQLKISSRTVEYYFINIKQKFNCKTRIEVVGKLQELNV